MDPWLFLIHPNGDEIYFFASIALSRSGIQVFKPFEVDRRALMIAKELGMVMATSITLTLSRSLTEGSRYFHDRRPFG